MEFEEDRRDDDRSSVLLPPDDRIWRHPSEVAGDHPELPPLAPLFEPPGPARWWAPGLVPVAVLTSAISVLLTLGVVVAVRRPPLGEPPQQMATNVNWSPGTGAALDLAAIAAQLRPSIVRIEAGGTAGTGEASGVLFRGDGLLLTSHRSVVGAKAILVELSDGRRMPARWVGGDPDTDIALLDLDGEDFPTARLGSASGLQVGEPAITMGGTARATWPMSVGVISALGQQLDTGGTRLVDMIQTDVPASAGCAGGALVDRTGAVVGIATASVATAGSISGYATPIDVARVVAQQLAATGDVTRVWLGIEGRDADPAEAARLGVSGAATVTGVMPDSPAESAGLATADLIVSVDGHALPSMAALVVALRSKTPGDHVALGLVRQGQRLVVEATLAARPTQPS